MTDGNDDDDDDDRKDSPSPRQPIDGSSSWHNY